MPSCRSRTCWMPLRFCRQHTWLLILSIACRTSTAQLQTLLPVHGVVGAQDLSMFRKVGSGDCLAPASRSVRGRARRDMTHLTCRQLCQSTCIGYTYAPCESVCTLHGDPSKIANTSDADGWATVNGGGKIDTSSKRCGANCYQRMAPCAAGEIVSNNAFMTHGPIAYGSTAVLTCPLPYMGMLIVRCYLEGAFLEAGRCKKPCSSGVVITGNFDVPYPQILHGELYRAPCPQGASGTVILTCLDGTATWESGNCGYDCVLGSLEAGDAVLTYPAIKHMSTMNLTCPNGTTGNVTVECDDSTVKLLSGMCKYDCPEGNLSLDFHNTTGMIFYGDFISGEENDTSCEPEYNLTGEITILCYRGKVNISSGQCYRHCMPSTIGPGVKAVGHGRLEHAQETTLKCEPGFVGDIRVKCNDSVVTIVSGECMMDCVPGSVTSNGVTIPHGLLNHSGGVELVCPTGYTGNLSVTCNDGAVRYSGECGKNCAPGNVTSMDAMVFYPVIPHGVRMNITCPRPWVGYVNLFCYDGDLRWDGGDIAGRGSDWCGRMCPAGRTASRGATVYFPAMNHSESINYECEANFDTGLTFSGGITVECDNGLPRTRGACSADCPPGTMNYQGSTIRFEKILHGGSIQAVCDPGTPELPLFGQVTVTCNDGYTRIIDGTCGQPCFAGGFFGPQTMDTTVFHGDIPHLGSRWVICPSELSGHVELSCNSGEVTAIGNGTCGKRCDGRYMDVYGSIVTIPLMEHRGRLKPACNKPDFGGYVFLECDFGGLNVTSFCEYVCHAGSITVNNGLVVDHPLLQSGELYPRQCPSGGIGSLVLKCKNGKVDVHSGGCYQHCAADWFYNPEVLPLKNSWSVSYYEILHNTTQEADCPQYYDGKVTLYCWNDNVTAIHGRCSTNCRPGRNMIRQGVVVMNREMVTGTMTNSFPCPIGFTGNLRLLCMEGVVSLGEGGCNATCPPGVIDTAPHGELFHGDYVELACPDTGTIFVSCFDGVAKYEGGKCYEGCPAGKLVDENGTTIEHSYIRHNESQAGACIGLAVGNVNLYCNDTVVVQRRLPGEQCLRSCRDEPLNFSDGIQLMPPVTAHGNQATTRCPFGILGLITLRCFDTDWQLVSGACGDMNCAPGSKISNGAMISHGEINNGWQGGPTECPAPYKGIATFSCDNGTSKVDEVTMQLPVSPVDFEAIAIGNESSDDSRFVICGCCLPMSAPKNNEVMVENDSGVYIWVLATAGGLAVIIAAIAGWYFLPKKKVSRVWPDETTLAVRVEPRPTKAAPVDPVHYNFALMLHNNPELAYHSEKLKALPDKQQQLMIKAMQDDPKVINNFFSRRSIAFITATEQNKVALAIQDKPASARSGRVRGGRVQGVQTPTGSNNNLALTNGSNNNLALTNAPNQLRMTAQNDVQFMVPTQQAERTINPLPNNQLAIRQAQS